MESPRRRDTAVDLALLGVGLTLESVEYVRDRLPRGVGVWVAEYTRDPYVTASLMTSARPAALGTAVSQAFPRSPLVTANAALDLDELSRGRFQLGLGSQVARANKRWHGITVEHPVERLTDYVHAVRAACTALAGGAPTYDGEFYSFDLSGRARTPRPSRVPPIHIAAVQPRMARAAGAAADGVVGHMLCTPSYLKATLLPEIAAGAATSGRDIEDVKLLLYRCCVPTDGGPEAEYDARRQIGWYASTRTYLSALDDMGFRDEALAAQAAMASGDQDALARAVSDDMLSAFAVVGTRAECLATLRTLSGEVDRFLLFPPYLGVEEDRLLAYHEAVLGLAGDHAQEAGV